MPVNNAESPEKGYGGTTKGVNLFRAEGFFDSNLLRIVG